MTRDLNLRCLADSNRRKVLLSAYTSSLADGVGEEDEDGHEDGEGYEGDAEELL